MNTKRTLAATIALTCALGLSACNQQESMSETAEDVAEARADRRDVRDIDLTVVVAVGKLRPVPVRAGGILAEVAAKRS